MLSSAIYIGKLPHKGQVYDGNHPPLIDLAQWSAVQEGIAANRVDRRYRYNAKNPSPLAGLLYDAKGMRFTPTHTVKKTGQRYRYYVDPALTTGVTPAKADLPRIPALEIEHAVRKGLTRFLNDTKALLAALGSGTKGPAAERAISRARELAADLLNATPMTWMPLIGPALEKIVLRENAIVFSIESNGLRDILIGQAAESTAAPSGKSSNVRESTSILYPVPAEVRFRRSGAMKLVIGNESAVPPIPDPTLLGTVARAYVWAEKLKSGDADSVREIAKTEGVTESYVTRMLRLGFLAPVVVEAIVHGQQSDELTADRLFKSFSSVRWKEQ